MFDDKLTRLLYVNRVSAEKTKPSPLLPREPVSSEVIDLRRKSSLFKARGDEMAQRAAIEESHRRSVQYEREAQIAYDLATKYAEQAEGLVSHTGIGMKSEVALDPFKERTYGEEILEHYGRKGMRWGQRIFGKKGKASSGKSKKIKKMSDEELSEAIKRMRLEEDYRRLDSAKKERGRSVVRDILASSTKKAASKHATKLIFDGMTKAIQHYRPDYSPQ